MSLIPVKQPYTKVKVEPRKFLTWLPASAFIAFSQEAMERGMSPYDLGGAVIAEWLTSQGHAVEFEPPSPSPSVADSTGE